jgi:putative nucleotidyltransferase with HDIG domain
LDWYALLESFALQAAIAMDNHELFRNLQRSNSELSIAYEATIEGWSHALDLRDKETEGHSQRVTELTVQLARAMGVNEQELGHIRRGALLHDIGKMGVPDAILLKPGSLTPEERAVMQNHTRYAYEMLYPIDYLRPALAISYCHHEKWDGTGYPRGLKGEEIPLAARIFTVVDVWDALTSDRPYRAAWTNFQACDYITSRAGTEFDPQVVQVFLKIVRDTRTGAI